MQGLLSKTKPHEESQKSVLSIFTNFIICILTVLVTLYFLNLYVNDDVQHFVSQNDNKVYEVRSSGSTATKQQAADYLLQLKTNINTLVSYMHDNKLPDQETADRLYDRWIHCKLRETSSNEDSIAFTINKGHEIRICIRNGTNSFEDINTSLFVILHELAHIMSVSYGHNEEFNEHFSYITHLATSLGLYKPEDFHKEPKTYCGIKISNSPLYT